MLNTYDNIISLGEACFVATTLNNLKLRQFSSPFDWVMGTGLQYRLDSLLNDFADFIEIKDLSKLDIDDPETEFDSYVNLKSGIVFNHEFPKNKNIDESYIEVRNKYDRRCKRLLELLYTKQDHLLLYMDLTIPKEPLSIDQLTEYMVRINHKFKSNSIELLYFRYVEKVEDGTIRKINKYLSIADYNGVVDPNMNVNLK